MMLTILVVKSHISRTSPFFLKLKHWRHANHSFIPTRRQFLNAHLIRVPLFFGALHTYHLLEGQLYWPNLIEGDYSPKKESILRRWPESQWRECLIRFWLPWQYVLPSYLSMSAAYSAFAILSVVVFQDDWARWRPLFGDIRDATTLRRFWKYVCSLSLNGW